MNDHTSNTNSAGSTDATSPSWMLPAVAIALWVVIILAAVFMFLVPIE